MATCPKVYTFILLLVLLLLGLVNAAKDESADYEDYDDVDGSDQDGSRQDNNDRNAAISDENDDDSDYAESAAEHGAEETNEMSEVHVRSARTESQFVGTNLLGLNSGRSRCFTQEDVALLVARKAYEKLLPRFAGAPTLETDRTVQMTLEYFRGAQAIVAQRCGPQTRPVSRMALADLLGGYMHFVYVPLVRLSFYAGTVDYTNARAVLQTHDGLKRALNTMGTGWRTPRAERFRAQSICVRALNVSVAIRDRNDGAASTDPDRLPCAGLLLSAHDRQESNRMLVALPRFEMSAPESAAAGPQRLELLWLPFQGRRRRTYEATSRASAFVLLRYYVDVMRCYAFKRLPARKFERRFADWLADRVLPLTRDVDASVPFYPALGGILRVAQTLHVGRGAIAERQRRRNHEPPSDAVGDSQPAPSNVAYDDYDRKQVSEDFASIEREVQDILRTRDASPANARTLDRALQKLNASNRRQRINTRALLVLCTIGTVLLVLTACLVWITLRRRRRHRKKRKARESTALEEGDDESSMDDPPPKPKKRLWHMLRDKHRQQKKHGKPKPNRDYDDSVIDCLPDSPAVMRTRLQNSCELKVPENRGIV